VRKFYLFLLCVAGFAASAFCGEFEDNLKQSVKESFNEELQIVSVDSFKGFAGVSFVVLKNKEGNVMPLYVSKDGKSFLAVSQYFHFADNSDKELFVKKMGEVEELNKQASAKKLDAVFDALPKESYVFLKSKTKSDDLLTIVTDPDCPYCRVELKNLQEHLKTKNVKLLIAPVHDEKAYIKGALILQETKKLKPEDHDKVIAIFEKYYQDIELDDKQSQTNTSVIHNNADKIFGSGFIRGVPYLHNGKIK
jgi:thiol:disulfide interchange protein DsbC